VDYIDTSVLASYYCPDGGSDLAQKTLQKCKRPVLSTLTRVELYCALSRKVRDQSLGKDEAHKIIALFEKHVRAPYYTMLAVRPRDHRQVSKWIAQFSSPLRVLDALHLAVAHANECRLLTADYALAKAARQFGVHCRLLAPR